MRLVVAPWPAILATIPGVMMLSGPRRAAALTIGRIAPSPIRTLIAPDSSSMAQGRHRGIDSPGESSRGPIGGSDDADLILFSPFAAALPGTTYASLMSDAPSVIASPLAARG